MLGKFFTQPLVHFFGIGATLFVLFAVVAEPVEAPGKPQIVVSEEDALWLASQFEATWRRQPTKAELQNLLDDFVSEEIYVREALAMGLDQGDTIVRRRLRQKVEFISEAAAEAADPDEETLSRFYQENAAVFTSGDRVAFSQVLLPAEGAIELDALRSALANGTPIDSIAQPTLLPTEFSLSPREAVDRTFGRGFFEQIAVLQQGEWAGPVQSGYGQHFVRVEAFEPGKLPPLNAVRDRVELDWRAQRASDMRAARFEELRAQYDIALPAIEDIVKP